eukprot:scaffold281317_cov37-Tisochrysis_lutea.AAC.2
MHQSAVCARHVAFGATQTKHEDLDFQQKAQHDVYVYGGLVTGKQAVVSMQRHAQPSSLRTRRQQCQRLP